jgi:nuclease S1
VKGLQPTSQLALFLFLMLIPSFLYAWAREGHEIIAMIAEERLQPDVRDAVVALLEGTTFIEAASWADQVRNQQTAPWHYVNIDIKDTEYDATRVCRQNQCVIAQIERFRKVLANPAAELRSGKKP